MMSIANESEILKGKLIYIKFIDDTSIVGTLLGTAEDVILISGRDSKKEYFVNTQNVKYLGEHSEPKVR